MLTLTILQLSASGTKPHFQPIATIAIAGDGAVTLRGSLSAISLDPLEDRGGDVVELAADPPRWAQLFAKTVRGPDLRVTIEPGTEGALAASGPSPLAALRAATGLNASQAAAEIGVSQPAYSTAEKRGMGISLETLQRYANGLGAELAGVRLQLASGFVVHWNPQPTPAEQ